MSKNETTAGQARNPKDMFAACQQSMDKIFGGVRQSVPQYHQSITNVQQEYLQALENLADSSLELQKEFLKKAGIATSVPEATVRVVRDTAEECTKAASLQNQMVLATIDAAQQNIKTFNDNAKSFADLNRNILQSWFSTFATRNVQ